MKLLALFLTLNLYVCLQAMIKDEIKPPKTAKAVAALVRNQVDLDRPDVTGKTVLMHCAADGKRKAVEALIAAKARVDITDRAGQLAIDHAVAAYTASTSEKKKARYKSVMLNLINAGSPCEADQNCLYALFCEAAQEGMPVAIQKLHEHKVPLLAVDEAGNNALHYAVRKISMPKDCSHIQLENKCEVIKLLCKQGILPNLTNNAKETPLMAAVEEDNPSAAYTLLTQEKIDVNAKGIDGFTAAHSALAYNSREIARMLIEHVSFDPTITNDLLMTPLHIAAVYADKELVEILLKLNTTNPNAQDADGNTPLHLAIMGSSLRDKIFNYMAHGRDPIVALLKNAQKGLPDRKNKKGLTASELARQEASFFDALLNPDRKKIWARFTESQESRVRTRAVSYRASYSVQV